MMLIIVFLFLNLIDTVNMNRNVEVHVVQFNLLAWNGYSFLCRHEQLIYCLGEHYYSCFRHRVYNP